MKTLMKKMMKVAAALLMVIGSVLLITGCGGPSVKQSYSPSKKSKPYTIRGERYYPIDSAHGFVEEGLASWYGADFHGKKTANGEIYNMYAETAAHKILPLNSKVRVTNLENGRSMEVRINDRGPFVKGRIIDLSKTAAEKLGIIGPGTARVRVESLTGVPRNAQGDFIGHFYIQVGSFTVANNAKLLRSRLTALGYSSHRTTTAYVGGRKFSRVQVGAYSGLSVAMDARRQLEEHFPSCFIIAD